MVRMAFAILLSALTVTACDNQEPGTEVPLIHPDAVITLESEGDRAWVLLAAGIFMGPDAGPDTRRTLLLCQQGEVLVWYQYLGPQTPREDPAADSPGAGDAYLIHLRMHDASEEEFPVVYRGGRLVVVDRPEVRIMIDEGPTRVPGA